MVVARKIQIKRLTRKRESCQVASLRLQRSGSVLDFHATILNRQRSLRAMTHSLPTHGRSMEQIGTR